MSSTLTPTQTLPAAERFLLIINNLMQATARRHVGPMYPRGIPSALATLIVWRLSRVRRRFISIMERLRAGTLRPRRPRAKPALATAATHEKPPRQPDLLPRVWGWLCALVPTEAANYGGQLAYLLEDPEMQALLVQAPQLWRLMNPILHMTGNTPHPVIVRQNRRNLRALALAAAREAALAAGEQPAPEPSAPAARPPRRERRERRERRDDSWMPHHPKQVAALLPGYRERRSR
jgi:hypothetical protein